MSVNQLLLGGKALPPEPFDVSRLSMVRSHSISVSYPNFGLDPIDYSPDGSLIYRRSSRYLYYERLATPYDSSGVGPSFLTGQNVNLYNLASAGGATNPSFLFSTSNFVWVDNGSKLIVSAPYYSTGWSVFSFSASTPYDPSTLSFAAEVSPAIPSQTATTYYSRIGVTFSGDGLSMYAYNPYGAAEFWVYPLATPWDITTIGSSSYYDVSAVVPNYKYPTHLAFDPQGTKVCIRDTIYPLSSAWDVSTIGAGTAYSGSLSGNVQLIPGSGRALINVSSSYYSQSIENACDVLATSWDAAGGGSQEWSIFYGYNPTSMYYPVWASVDEDRILCTYFPNYYRKYVTGLASGATVEEPAGKNTSFGGPTAFTPAGVEIIGLSGSTLKKAPLATPWDLNTVGTESSVTLTKTYNRRFLSFNGAGDFAIAGEYDSATGATTIRALTFGTPWDITTVQEPAGNEVVIPSVVSAAAISANSDVLVALHDSRLHRYPIQIPGDLSSIAGFDRQSDTLRSLTGYAISSSDGLFFSGDGMQAFLLDYGGRDIALMEVR